MPNDHLEELLRRNLELNKENNALLKKMRRTAMWGIAFKVLWVAVLIGVPVAVYYYFLMPYLDGLREGYQQFERQWGDINIPGFGPLLDAWLGEGQTNSAQ